MPVKPNFSRDDYNAAQALIEAATDAGGLPVLTDMDVAAAIPGSVTTLSVPDFGPEVDTTNIDSLVYAYFVNNIDTSIVLRVEGYIEAVTNWVNVANDNLDTIVYENKKHYFLVDSQPFTKIRFGFIREYGGTNATVAIAASAK